MPKKLKEGACYAGRSQGVVPCNFSLDREAYEFLGMIAPTRRSFGHVISRVLLEERARMQQRIEWRTKMQMEADEFWSKC